MKECYHDHCDNANNPKLNFERSIDFIQQTAQAVTLAVADLAEGINKCNVEHLFATDGTSNVNDESIKGKNIF